MEDFYKELFTAWVNGDKVTAYKQFSELTPTEKEDCIHYIVTPELSRLFSDQDRIAILSGLLKRRLF